MNSNTTRVACPYDKHVQDVRRILTELHCMNSKGQIRAWKKDAWQKLNEAGHNHLCPTDCQCGIEYRASIPTR